MVAVHRPGLLLEIDVTAPLVDIEPEDLVGKLRSRHRPRLRAVLRALHEAGDDPRVRGLIVKVGGGWLPMAVAQEIREGLRAFGSSGKPTVAWAEAFGPNNGTVEYLLATGCDEIWLQPGGDLALLGVAAETTFLRGALDKLHIEPQLDKRHEYKSAADRITNTEFTDAHREAIDRVVESTWDETVAAIAHARGLEQHRVRELADRAPIPAAEAMTSGLVDRLGYRDEVYCAIRERLDGGGEHPVQLRYADRWSPRSKTTELIRRQRGYVALVEGHGEIVSGRGSGNARGPRMGSETVSAALRAAREDDHAHAVLFRVDSPGGSAVASETIWREVLLTRDAGKPVIVSMGALAGSGGYYVSCAANVIVAQPATITGSIGVLSGKLVVSELLERMGLTTGVVARGNNARMYSMREKFSENEWQRMGEELDRIYADFVGKVAAGRSMTPEAVDGVARGRIWSGADAAGNGLVDVIGGRHAAADIARERARLRSDAPVRPAVHIPPLRRMRRPVSSDDPRTAAIRMPALSMTTALAEIGGWGAFAPMAAALNLPSAGPLIMPDVRLR